MHFLIFYTNFIFVVVVVVAKPLKMFLINSNVFITGAEAMVPWLRVLATQRDLGLIASTYMGTDNHL